MPYRRRIDGPGGRIGLHEFAKPVEEGTSHLKSDLDSMLVAHIEKRPLDLPLTCHAIRSDASAPVKVRPSTRSRCTNRRGARGTPR